jgi:hypothetical protein
MVHRSEVSRGKNPFSKHYQKKSRLLKIYGFLAIVLILGLGYFLLYSDRFEIKNIDVSGTRNIRADDIKSIAESQIAERRFLIFKQRNLFAFSKKELTEKINDKYVLDDLRINKDLPGSLKIEIKEKISLVIWVSNNRYYNLDSNGIAISEILNLNKSKSTKNKTQEETAPEPEFFDIKPLNSGELIDNREISSFPLIFDETNNEVVLGQSVISSDMISIILNLNKKIPEKINISVNSFKIPELGSREVKIVTNEKWEIYFDTNKDIEMQLNNLKLTLDEKIKGNRSSLQYIDLRFGNRVYYQ